MSKKTNIEKRVCFVCRSNDTYIYHGSSKWYRHIDNKGDWTGNWLCCNCYNNIRNSLDDSYNNIKKLVTNWRTGNVDRDSNDGKAFISQWVGAKVLGLKDLNIENKNYHEPIDLSRHHLYGNIDVKVGIWISVGEYWNVNIRKYDFDTIIIVCTDQHRPWQNIERVYIIPKDILKSVVSIYKNPSRSVWYEKYRTDNKCYNYIYHTVDIPKYFSPFDLWNGKYKKPVDKR
jgi:hypothetical protein